MCGYASLLIILLDMSTASVTGYTVGNNENNARECGQKLNEHEAGGRSLTVLGPFLKEQPESLHASRHMYTILTFSFLI